ncbi:hypothetical protein FHX42_000182 [Saccharopolyspora lacisalsi]|uniref:Prealbumin-like fold domain-containing protein n=1 Tax=Halosaccharopolyspora lacisalsi TaxID=1000566 RepID=A0A839DP65_9PSEU|nr:hypothetical protein [Halosaccharopolyspora lacisalsi]MBA8822853.1 hypothetical protein [Halosaccharopolyspora lacisalsi]
MRVFGKLLVTITGAALLAGGTLTAAPGVAQAAPQEGIGHEIRPGQPYGDRDRPSDWLGSYMVDGEQVWCVQFALKAPDSDEAYEPGDVLKTKWGTAIPDDTAANISYLLLRYGDTESADEAAALAHLLHSWTAAPRTPEDLDRKNDFREIAYDVEKHFAKLPGGAKDAVERLREDAEANRGPWQASLTEPEDEQVIGESAEWTLRVTQRDGDGVGGVPVELDATDAEVEGLSDDGTVTTPADGGPVKLRVTPTGPNPEVTGTLAAPAERPYVREAVHKPGTTQRVVSTGGEQQLTVEAATTAVTAPGVVEISKIDSQSRDGIAGVKLRVTGPDEKTPATEQDGTELVGPEGEPLVVTTGSDGTATVPELRTPQEVCVVETAPAKGYGEAFDPAAPPSACGTLKPGETLALELVNKPNTPSVPITIPAGDTTVAAGDVPSGDSGDGGAPLGLFGLGGGLLLTGAVGGGVLLRRRRFETGRQR